MRAHTHTHIRDHYEKAYNDLQMDCCQVSCAASPASLHMCVASVMFTEVYEGSLRISSPFEIEHEGGNKQETDRNNGELHEGTP